MKLLKYSFICSFIVLQCQVLFSSVLSEVENTQNSHAAYFRANPPPDVQDGSASTPENTPVIISLNSTDDNSDLNTFHILTPPMSGMLSPITQPSMGAPAQMATVTYTPDLNFFGSDSFTFNATSVNGTSNTGTISITVTTVDTPIANNGSATIIKNIAQTITLTATDPNGTLVTFSIVSAPTQGTLSSITQPITPGVDQSASVTYTPNHNFVGFDSFTFKVNNGSQDSNIATESLTVSQPPIPLSVVDDFIIRLIQKYHATVTQ